MNYKVERALKKGKAVIIIAIILWLLMAILVIMPFTCAMYQIKLLGGFNSGAFTRVFSTTASSPGTGFAALIQYGIMGNYLKNLFGFSLIYSIFVVVGFIRLMPKHRYDDIEYG